MTATNDHLPVEATILHRFVRLAAHAANTKAAFAVTGVGEAAIRTSFGLPEVADTRTWFGTVAELVPGERQATTQLPDLAGRSRGMRWWPGRRF